MVNLYKWHKIIGEWRIVRSHDITDAEEWQRIFMQDEPNEYFYTAKKTPTFNPVPKAF